MLKLSKLIMTFFLAALAILLVLYFCFVICLGVVMPHQWYADVTQTQTLEFPQGSIRYTESGSGENAVILLHGYNSQINIWNHIWSDMDACTHTIRLDLPGFGGSQWQTNDYNLNAQATRVVAFLQTKNITRVTLVGTSMGASLAVMIAAKRPDLVSSLILMAPSGYPGSLTYTGIFGLFVKAGTLNRISIWVAKTLLFQWIFPHSIALQSLTTVSSYTDEWVNALVQIEAPVALLWSTGDTTVPYTFSGAISQALKYERLLSLDANVGHNTPIKESVRVAHLACAMAPEKGVVSLEQLDLIISHIFGRDL